jgi:hypothetical protein
MNKESINLAEFSKSFLDVRTEITYSRQFFLTLIRLFLTWLMGVDEPELMGNNSEMLMHPNNTIEYTA